MSHPIVFRKFCLKTKKSNIFHSGAVEYSSKIARNFCSKLSCLQLTEITQQGLGHFGARSVLAVRECDEMMRPPLVDSFNIPIVQN